MGKLGEYWDYAASVIPTWISSAISTLPPYLNCNGTSFSSAIYPQLANLLGTTTLPDSRGRVRIALNQTTNRVTVINGDVIFTGGGDQNLHAHTHTGSGTTAAENQNHAHTGSGTTTGDSVDHTHSYNTFTGPTVGGGGAFGAVASATGATTSGVSQFHTHDYSFTTGVENATHTHFYSFVTSTTGSGGSQNIQPSFVGGITMIRAA